MDAHIVNLKVGLMVKIKRSNGVIQDASITEVTAEKSVVRVEWLEDSISKAKEIDIENLLLLNPNLVEKMPPPSLPRRRTQIPKRELALPRNGIAIRSTRSRAQAQAALEVQIAPNLRMAEVEPVNYKNVSAGRKSTCVRETERLKKQRDDRRTQLHEIRGKRAQEYDTSNPNWEFMKMITEFRASLDCYHPLSTSDPVELHKICVCVRKRPLSRKEKMKKRD